jgi:ABC-type branched-subunit amino acid transport system permease subunit
VGAVLWLLLPSTLSGLAGEIGPSSGMVGKLLAESRAQVVSLIFGLLVALLLIFAPGGLVGAWRSLRRRLGRRPS